MNSAYSLNIFDGVDTAAERFLAVILILIAGYLVGKTLKLLVSKLAYYHREKASAVALLLGSITQFIVLIVSIVVALKVSGLNESVSGILAGAGIFGIALGFALQDIASNLMAGIILSVQKEMEVGDLIKVGEHMGHVEMIELRMTQIRTLDGKLVYIPNKELMLSTVEDYSRTGVRRAELNVGVAYDSDLELARSLAKEVVTSIEDTDENKKVRAYFSDFGESSINLRVLFWIRFEEQNDILSVKSQAIVAIKKAFDQNGIHIPFPIVTLDGGGSSNGRAHSPRPNKKSDTLKKPKARHA